MRDFGIVERLFAHEIRGGKARIDVTERLIDLAFDIARLLLVEQHGVGDARLGGVEIRGQGLDVEHDGGESRFRGRFVDRGHRGHGLAAIANLVAGERPLVLRDRDHAVGRGEILAR